jgi:type I restriction enzyme R subunit
MKEKFEIIGQMFNGFDYQAYFKVDTAQKLQVLLGAENFILADIQLKERFMPAIASFISTIGEPCPPLWR